MTGRLEYDDERCALQKFAANLGALNSESNEIFGIGSEETTRQEATLLMSLSCSHKPNPEEEESTSNSSEQGGLLSDSSSSRGGREEFRFSCPSLSLERSQITMISSSSSSRSRHHKHNPAVLLRRALTVEDRDALRLNADAMARNLSQSCQQALQWRIQTWKASLSKSLLQQERQLINKGVDKEQIIQEVCSTPEAKLLQTLQQVSKALRVTGSGTQFRLIEPNHSDEDVAPPPRKKRRRDSDPYSYNVAQELVLECSIALETPAGHSEITLEVPGCIRGSFVSPQEMISVVVTLDTDMLAAMLEKSCRKVVRLSASHILEAIATSSEPQEKDEIASSTEPQLSPLPTAHTPSLEGDSHASSLPTTTSMTPARLSFRSSPQDAVLVTPPPTITSFKQRTQNSLLLPIPDDFEDDDDVADEPRRISPQPEPSSSSYRAHSPPDQRWYSTHATTTRSTHHKDSQELALVSPPPCTTHEYQDFDLNASTGPYLPALVEVACRAMNDN